MKKIINGKKYDTETAQQVGYWTNGARGFGWMEERLYKKKTGEFFLYGEGGPMTKYAQHQDNLTTGGEKIEPLTEDMAKLWSENHLDGDEYESIFGEVEE